ncbi:MAG TPA: universal stress protein [Patescibacteria group bacterium]|nr:universal stress protein [Patescibacteria group bacterium]
MGMKRYIVAYDGSENSKKALALATDLAKSVSAEIFLVTVCDQILQQFEDVSLSPDMERDYEQHFADKAAEACEYCRSQGVQAQSAVLKGHPADEIIRYAKQVNADLLVSGTRGLGGFTQLLLGSVAHKLVTYSPIPVLIVK